ncbi:hypothetical protein HanRHA438_Chr14g0654791 [Helianthus annuus]|nr:hypothetical protein HanRHA438_Chr14g0654791 [Helianthus annuus]
MVGFCLIFLSQNKERYTVEINGREKKLNRAAASLTIGRPPERRRPRLTEQRVRNLMVVVMFAD